MARHTYKLSTETIKVLKPHVEKIAAEWNVSDKYVYAILAGTVTDPFAAFFLGPYTAALRAGVSVVPWITALKLQEEKYRPLSKELCVATEAKAFVKEANDVAIAHMGDEDLLRLRDEQLQANMQGERALKALNQEIERRNSQILYNGKPVANGIRNIVKSITQRKAS
jgi:hypothetical protein